MDVALASIAVLASVVLLHWIDKPMFRDEAASLYAAHLGWSALWRQSRVVDLVLLPYYALLHAWVLVSGSIAWVRALSLLAFGTTVYVTGRIGVRCGGVLCGLVCAVVAATNPLLVDAALYACPYALSALAATLAVAALLRWSSDGGTGWLWWFCAASVGALLLQMFSVLAPLAALGAVLCLRHRSFRDDRGALAGPTVVLAVATVVVVGAGAGQRGQIAWIPGFTGSGLAQAALGPAFGGSLRYTAVVAVSAVASLGYCLVAWRRGRFRPGAPLLGNLAVALAWAAVPAALLVAVSLVRPIYVDRYVTASVPGLAVVLGLLLSHAVHLAAAGRPARSRAAGAVLVALTALVGIACTVPSARAVPEDLRQAAGYLVLHAGTGSMVALPDHSVTTGIEYYVTGDGREIRLWPQLAVQPRIEGLDLRTDDATVAGASEDVWLLDDQSTAGVGAFVTMLERSGYTRVGTANLPGLAIVHFRRD